MVDQISKSHKYIVQVNRNSRLIASRTLLTTSGSEINEYGDALDGKTPDHLDEGEGEVEGCRLSGVGRTRVAVAEM